MNPNIQIGILFWETYSMPSATTYPLVTSAICTLEYFHQLMELMEEKL